MLDVTPSTLSRIDLASYDIILTALSGGKDSIASFLALIEAGADPAAMAVIHHHVDGLEGSTLMDWPSTPGYCEAFARHFNVPIIHSWRQGGFEAEMLRQNAPTAGVSYQIDDRRVDLAGAANAPLGTRMAFPQVAADLSVRYCSASLKIDVADRVLRNDPMFANKRTLFITGERAEESPNRARYAFFEPHRADRRNGKAGRTIDHCRPVLKWTEQQVWNIIARNGILPHPAYYAGFGRLSCRACIFANDAQWATLQTYDPVGFTTIAEYEARFGRTIHRKDSVLIRAARTLPFPAATENAMKKAMQPYIGGVFVPPDGWTMPPGAFSRHGGPS